jgi:signal transduction histidine kinase
MSYSSSSTHTIASRATYDGPFVFESLTFSVLTAQLYIAVAAVATLSLAALVFERKRFADELDASRAGLVEASDTERRRLEHNLHDGAQQRLSALAIRLGLARRSDRVLRLRRGAHQRAEARPPLIDTGARHPGSPHA